MTVSTTVSFIHTYLVPAHMFFILSPLLSTVITILITTPFSLIFALLFFFTTTLSLQLFLFLIFAQPLILCSTHLPNDVSRPSAPYFTLASRLPSPPPLPCPLFPAPPSLPPLPRYLLSLECRNIRLNIQSLSPPP